jgi:hypothetical protein
MHFPPQSRQILGQPRPALSADRAIRREMVGNDKKTMHRGFELNIHTYLLTAVEVGCRRAHVDD